MGVRGREIYARQREEAQRIAKETEKRYQEEQRKKRKVFTKKERQIVYEKCGGHCAYCGCELELKDMQIDHIVSVGWSYYGGEESKRLIAEGKMNEIDNLLPACRQCNFYKGMSNLEGFRSRLMWIHGCLLEVWFDIAKTHEGEKKSDVPELVAVGKMIDEFRELCRVYLGFDYKEGEFIDRKDGGDRFDRFKKTCKTL